MLDTIVRPTIYILHAICYVILENASCEIPNYLPENAEILDHSQMPDRVHPVFGDLLVISCLININESATIYSFECTVSGWGPNISATLPIKCKRVGIQPGDFLVLYSSIIRNRSIVLPAKLQNIGFFKHLKKYNVHNKTSYSLIYSCKKATLVGLRILYEMSIYDY